MHVKIKLFVTLEDTEMETGKRIMVIASIKPYNNTDIGNVINQPNTFGIKVKRKLFTSPQSGKSNNSGESKDFFFFPKNEMTNNNSAIASAM